MGDGNDDQFDLTRPPDEGARVVPFRRRRAKPERSELPAREQPPPPTATNPFLPSGQRFSDRIRSPAIALPPKTALQINQAIGEPQPTAGTAIPSLARPRQQTGRALPRLSDAVTPRRALIALAAVALIALIAVVVGHTLASSSAPRHAAHTALAKSTPALSVYGYDPRSSERPELPVPLRTNLRRLGTAIAAADALKRRPVGHRSATTTQSAPTSSSSAPTNVVTTPAPTTTTPPATTTPTYTPPASTTPTYTPPSSTGGSTSHSSGGGGTSSSGSPPCYPGQLGC